MRRTVGLEEVAHQEVSNIAASLQEGFASDGRAHCGKLGHILDEAPYALQAARQQRPDQALALPPVILSPACMSSFTPALYSQPRMLQTEKQAFGGRSVSYLSALGLASHTCASRAKRMPESWMCILKGCLLDSNCSYMED